MATIRERAERRRQFYRSFEAQALKQRSLFTQIADDINNAFGSLTFLILNLSLFVFWIVHNTGGIPGIPVVDPFPFNFLTMTVSLEAIVLSIFILVSQNRQAYVTSLREELLLQIDLIAEEEVTKCLKILAEIRKKMGITQRDPELEEMLEHINTSYIERTLVDQIQKAGIPLTKRVAEKLNRDFPDILHPFKPTPKL